MSSSKYLTRSIIERSIRNMSFVAAPDELFTSDVGRILNTASAVYGEMEVIQPCARVRLL